MAARVLLSFWFFAFLASCEHQPLDDRFYVCSHDTDCKIDLVTGLHLVGPAPADLVSSKCVQHLIIPPNSATHNLLSMVLPDGGTGGQPTALLCDCTLADGRLLELSGSSRDACELVGRRGQCLFARDEFPGCTLADPATCDAPCALLHERLIDDARATTDATVRSNRCIDGDCSLIFEVEGKCFHNTVDRSFDCALSDDAIRSRAAAH